MKVRRAESDNAPCMASGIRDISDAENETINCLVKIMEKQIKDAVIKPIFADKTAENI
jgi:hypothetical protein